MVLEIDNQSENWKTARCLAPLFGRGAIHLARLLGEPSGTPPEKVQLELFWKGMRDYRREPANRCTEEILGERYRDLFRDLRSQIKSFGGFQKLQPDNYRADTEPRQAKLARNLLNTEIDIVLESPRHLYIGEAKYKGKLHANGTYVLVHQLVRQHVMAKILVDLRGCDKTVVPFVLGANRERRQIKFMIDQGLMNEDHILSWPKVKGLSS